MNEENKSKIFIGTLVAVITLVIAVMGATFAFFSLNVSGDTTNTNVDIEAGNADVVTIEQGVENIHINLAVSDMAENNPNKAYYATTEEEDYKLNEGEGTLTFATIKGTNKEASDCTAKVTITMDTSDDSMGKALQKGDAILYITSGETEETVDLYDLLTEEMSDSVTKEIEVEISVSESAEASITGYLKVNNTEFDQSYLAGKTLNITIKVDNLVCGSTGSKGPLAPLEMLKAKGGETFAGGGDHTTVIDEMYRFVGTKDEVLNNYICFGTDNTETCITTPEDYMYRIIGITDKGGIVPANSLKIIKATPSSESQQWHWNSNNTKWDSSDIKEYLNGSFYNSIKDAQPNGTYWESLILSHSWYGAEVTEATSIEPKSPVTKGCKIGLMYASDYINSGEGNTDNWLFIANGWTGNIVKEEWTMSWYGLYDRYYDAWYVDDYFGRVSNDYGLEKEYAVRPVFYLDGSKIMLDGEGTIEAPYYITNA